MGWKVIQEEEHQKYWGNMASATNMDKTAASAAVRS